MIKWILSSSVLIGAVIGLRYLFRGKISARLQYALWALVLIRLLMPSGIFSMPFSVENLVGTIQSQPVVQDVITDLHEPGLTYDEAYEQAKNELLPNEPQPGQSSKPNGETAARINHRAGTLMQLATPSLIIETVLMGIWYIGIAAVGIVFLVSNIKFSITLRRKRQLLRKEKIRIFTCEGLDTPCLFGLFRPAIYLTPEDAADEERSQHILAHEQTHRKHWDHIWSFLRCVCLAIHWYNPLVWIAAIASRQDGELACDEATIKKLGEEQRIPYGETLVKTTYAAKSTTGILRTATTMTGSKEAIKQRILRIAHKFKFNVYAFISVLLIGAISIGCTWFGANPEDEIVTVYLLDQEVTTHYSDGSTVRNVWQYDDNYNLIGSTGALYKYDENNRLLFKASTVYGGGSVAYTYNSQGQIIQCDEQLGYSSNSKTYTYDEHGRVIRQEVKKDKTTILIDYFYDDNGILRASTKYQSDGYRVFKSYNTQGNLLKEEHYDGSTLTGYTEYTYDIFGRLIARTAGPDADYNNIIYTYDLAGRLVKEVFGDKRYTTPIIKDENIHITYAYPAPYTKYYHYNLQGHLIEETGDYYNGMESTLNITYDIYGRVARYHRVDCDIDLRYTYDGNGNIISKTSYSADGKVIYLNTYTYTAVQVSRKDAVRLLAQQDANTYFFPFEDYPPDPMPEKEQFYP